MPVSVMWAGRLGNAIIKYSVGRMFAENNDMLLLSDFPWPHVFSTTPCASGAVEVGKKHERSLFFNDEHPPDMGVGAYKDADVTMDGYFQNSEWLIPNRDRIRKFFRFPFAWFNKDGEIQLDRTHMVHADNLTRNTEDLAIHVRLTDGATLSGLNHVIHPEWFESILSKEAKNYRRISIYTDDPAARGMFDVFKKYNAKVYSRSVAEDFLSLMCHENVILAPSTFSYTSCLLGFCKRAWVHDPFITIPAVKLDWPGAIKVRGGFINGRCA